MVAGERERVTRIYGPGKFWQQPGVLIESSTSHHST